MPVPVGPKRKPHLGPDSYRRSEKETSSTPSKMRENVGTPGVEAVRGHEASAMQLRRFM